MKAFYSVCMMTIRIWMREPLTVFLSLGLLVLMMVLFSTMGHDTFQYKLAVGVVAPAQSFAQIQNRIERDGTLRAVAVSGDTELREGIRQGKLNAGVEIAAGQAQIAVLLPNSAASGWAAVANEHLVATLDRQSKPAVQGLNILNIAAPQSNVRFIDFLFPGILSLSILQTCLGSAVVFLDARRIGILRRFRLAPVRPAVWSCGFLGGRCAIVLLHILVLATVARLVFHVRALGSIQDACLVSLVGTVCFLALSGVISLLAPSVEAGALLTQLLNFPMSFLCGVFFRNDNLSPLLHRFVDVLPFTYMVNLMREIVQMGVPLKELHHDMNALLAWTAASLLILAVTSRFHSSQAI